MKAMIGDKRQQPESLPEIDVQKTLISGKRIVEKESKNQEQEVKGVKQNSDGKKKRNTGQESAKVSSSRASRDRVIHLEKQADSDILES